MKLYIWFQGSCCLLPGTLLPGQTAADVWSDQAPKGSCKDPATLFRLPWTNPISSLTRKYISALRMTWRSQEWSPLAAENPPFEHRLKRIVCWPQAVHEHSLSARYNTTHFNHIRYSSKAVNINENKSELKKYSLKGESTCEGLFRCWKVSKKMLWKKRIPCLIMSQNHLQNQRNLWHFLNVRLWSSFP